MSYNQEYFLWIKYINLNIYILYSRFNKLTKSNNFLMLFSYMNLPLDVAVSGAKLGSIVLEWCYFLDRFR